MTATELDTPIGKMVLAATEAALTGAWFVGQRFFGANYDMTPGDNEALRQTKGWLTAYFSGNKPDPRALPLAPVGSDFRHKVWDILLEIPYGQTVTYGNIAKELERRYGVRVSAQAVGGAVGHNPISIIVPCHRVLGSGGALTGYAGGIEKKQWLLELESGFAAR